MDSSKYVSSQVLKMILLYLEAAEGHPSVLQEIPGLGPAFFGPKDARIDASKARTLLDMIAGRFPQAMSGLRMAEGIHRSFRQNLILMNIMANCSSVGKAIEKLICYHDISTNIMTLRLEHQGNDPALIWEPTVALPAGFDSILTEAVVASCCLMLRDITMDKIRFSQVCFAHAALEDADAYRRVFKCQAVFNSNRNKVLIPKAEMGCAIELSDPHLLDVLEQYAGNMMSRNSEGQRLSNQVADLVSERILSGGDYHVELLARRLAMSTRTLQERLRGEGLTYRRIVEAVRKRIAEKSLADPNVNLSDIAFLLGFSEQSAFNHAFRKWTGSTPGQYKSSLSSATARKGS